MTWDLRLDPNTRDLRPGIATGRNEILQRLTTRLQRELGEWFLNTGGGIPWYQNGNGLLGSRNNVTLDLLVRRETLETEGVLRVLTLNTLFSSRNYRIYMQLLLEGSENEAVEFSFSSEVS